MTPALALAALLGAPPTLAETIAALAEADRQVRECRADLTAARSRLAARTSSAARDVIVYCPAPPPPVVAVEARPWWLDLLSHAGASAAGAAVGRLTCQGAP